MPFFSSLRRNPYVYNSNLDIVNKNVTSRVNEVALLLIDPQNDFHEGGSLAVPGADGDSIRIAEFIKTQDLDGIYVTLDTHQQFHIAHSLFWTNDKCEHPVPFTVITVQDIQDKVWYPTHKKFNKHVKKYAKALKKDGKFDLIIWPDHCLVGTQGHNVVPIVSNELLAWERRHVKCVNYVEKGCNSMTEHYSAFKADVTLSDPKTQLNTGLIKDLAKFDKIYIAGQAKSHCVNWSCRDLLEAWVKMGLSPDRLVFMDEYTSPVSGFEDLAETAVNDFNKAGMTIMK